MRPDSGLLPGHYLNYMSAKTKSDLEEENTCAQTAASFRATKCITYTPNCVLFFKQQTMMKSCQSVSGFDAQCSILVHTFE